MGFSGIIATGLMAIMLIVAGYIVLAGLNYAVDSASAALATARDAREGRLHTALCLSDADAAGDRLDFNVTNAGAAPVGNVSGLDVLVKGIGDGRVTSCTWLAPGASAEAGTWCVLYKVDRFPGSPSELGPGDTVRVRCTFAGSAAPDAGLIEVAAPAGTAATLLYNDLGT